MRRGAGFKTARIQSDLQRNLSALISREVSDPRVATASPLLSFLKLSKDLSQAKVYISFMNDALKENDKQEVLRILQEAEGFFRSRLSSVIRTRSVPKLLFFYDDFAEQVEEIDRNLAQEQAALDKIVSQSGDKDPDEGS